MDHTERLADTDVLDRLLEGSFETVIDQIESAVEEQLELFGGGDGVEVAIKGTYPQHVIVMNDQLDFYRAEWSINEGKVSFGNIERVDVPVKEARHLGRESFEYAEAVIDAALEGDDDTVKKGLSKLFDLTRRGIKLTAEAIEDDIDLFVGVEQPWLTAVRDNAPVMRGFVGARAHADLPKPRFEALIDADDLDEETETKYRKVVAGALRRLVTTLEDQSNAIALAHRINENYELKMEGASVMEVDDFIEFVDQFSTDVDGLTDLIESAVAISVNGTLKSLARIHDKLAENMVDISLAASFAEKFATRFSAPVA